MRPSQTTRIASHISPEEIREQSDRLLASRTFAHGTRLRRLLAFMVRHSLLDHHRRITQAMIARAVLENKDFDSAFDSSVRRLAARLRERLRDYYGDEGRQDPLMIAFPKGQPYRLQAARRSSFEAVHPVDDAAFEEYRKGRALWAARTPESLQAAMDCFRRAIKLFPAYSMAHTALGECYSFMAIWGSAPTEVIPSAKGHALRALEINEHNPDAHALLAAILSAYDWDWESATREFQRALALDDKNPGIYRWYSAHLVSLERYEEAVHYVRLAQATERSVPSVLVNAHAAKILLVCSCHESARSLLGKMQEEDPRFYLTPLYLGILEGIMGTDYTSAIQSLERAAALSNQNSQVLAVLGSVYAKAGRSAEAESLISILLRRRQEMYVPATDLVSLYAALKRFDAAFEYLEYALEEKCWFLSWLTSWPPLKDICRDPRIDCVLRRLGFNLQPAS